MTGTKRTLSVAVLLAIAAAAVAVATVLIVRRPHAADTNAAVVDGTRTAQVVGQVSTALNNVLSYSYKDPSPTQAAAKQWLAGDAVGQYHYLFTELQKRAPGQQLSFVAKVVTAGVTSLKGNTAQLLVFLDQKSTRASDAASSVAAAQVLITAVQKNGTWQITELRPL